MQYEFYQPFTFWDYARKTGILHEGSEEFYARMNQGPRDKVIESQSSVEVGWIRNKRPFYNFYPGIVRPLIKLDFSKVKCESLHLPLNFLAICLPKGHGIIKFSKHELQFAFVSEQISRRGNRLLGTFFYFGEIVNGFPLCTYNNLNLSQGEYLIDAVIKSVDPSIKIGIKVTEEESLQVLKLVAGLCLIDKGEDLIEPEVLAKDRQKWELTKNDRLIEKAKQRGRFGFSVGRNIEVSPHWRNPSPLALYWTGKGKVVPLLRYRRGTIVKKEIAAKIPTGYEGQVNE